MERTGLSVMEQWWAQWYIYIGDPVLATGIMSFLMHEVSLSPLGLAHAVQLPFLLDYKSFSYILLFFYCSNSTLEF